ncbi:hypothetical protein [Kribbella sp. NPDC051718]|uniref:hypothetical protein n=1 Tax=Kribbella sp. NPDC051718 TaxID=3155168 RepID=UPI0034412A76
MTVVGRHEEDHYMPESGILVLREPWATSWEDPLSTSNAHPVGSIVRTGQGWVYASGGDGPCVVRLRSHTSPPADDDEDWTDLVEAPYRSTSGAVGLTTITGGADEEHLPLGEPGLYRLRVAHRPLPQTVEDEEYLQPRDLWQLDFWPVDGAAEPPRWLRRQNPTVWPADPGWGRLLGYPAVDIVNVVEWNSSGPGLTVDDLQQWGIDHNRGDNWLDQPLGRQSASPGYPTLAEIANQVGLPAPSVRREMLSLAVALGFLTFDGQGYGRAVQPPMAFDVLDLSPNVVKFLKGSSQVKQFTGYAADLVSIALWGGAEQTIASLADRTLASEENVRATLRYAETRRLLQLDHRPENRFTLTAL